VAGTLAIPVLSPVRSLPAYTCHRNPVPVSASALASSSHPASPGTFSPRRAVRRPQRSNRGPDTRQPIGVPMEARLAATAAEVERYVKFIVPPKRRRTCSALRGSNSSVCDLGLSPIHEASSCVTVADWFPDCIAGRAIAE
jgi:hypothetical protein